MAEDSPTPTIPDDVPTSVVYDMATETATHLSAHYVQLSRSAATEDERQRWWTRVIELRDAKDAVNAHDRATLLARISAWTAEIRALDEEHRG
ncbi:hypothetical protein MXD59_16525 [Frankia sp. Ag45/Mut15]|uniref:Uncharacterized protein n=1 Tax=Frankia umida TaxID=573489 RepID=A0ABT0K0M0_9ACTN|nr:hypothetical protein [Frankia umida]MCK9877355.1 hypothetical protein [Frankia umida]